MTLQTLLAAIASLALLSSPALAQTPETLIAAAKPGTTLVLPAGYKGTGYIRNVVKAPPVTVTCADTSCLLTDIKLQASQGVIFDGLTFATSGAAPALAITAGSHGSGVQNCKVYGLKALTGGGVSIADSNGGFVTNCELTDLSGGINVLRSQGVAVTNNRIHNFSVDAVQFNGSSNVTFTGNKVWDSFPVPGAHNDAVQFFTLNTTSPTHDLLIESNVFWRGKGQVFQGVFMGNEAKIPYDRVTIRGNTACGTMYNGIAVYQATNALIEGNTVTGYPAPDMVSWISTSGVTGIVQNNRAQQFNTPAAAGLTLAGNTVIPPSSDSCGTILAALNPVPTPVPVPVPLPPAGPTQAELDAANAQIAQLTLALNAAKAQDVADLATIAAAQKAVSDAQAVAASLQAALDAERIAKAAAQAELLRKQGLLDNIAALASQ